MLFVFLLILVDVGFMCLHIILEGAIAHFNIRQTKSDEKPVSVEGVSPKTYLNCMIDVRIFFRYWKLDQRIFSTVVHPTHG